MDSINIERTRVRQDDFAGLESRKLLCVGDDITNSRQRLKQISTSGWHTLVVSSATEASSVCKNNDDVRVGIARVTKQNYLEIEELIVTHCEMEWVAMTTENELEGSSAVQDLLSSRLFYDYHTLPFDYERLAITLGHAYGIAELRRSYLERRNGSEVANTQYHMLGASKAMRSIYSTIEKVAPTDFPVLITGRSGTGKELVARAIHTHSRRADKPLIVINCGALVPTLIQSELFGHVKGSFTTAEKNHKGCFESAHGGTIFLDEIGELPPEVQANLLRVLEEKAIRRIGGSENIDSDARVIAATNIDLSQAVTDGTFRNDLFHRLNVVHIDVPPLTERLEDLEILAAYFIHKFAPSVNSRARGLSKKALEAMLQHDWPGNVRELMNRIKRAVLMSESRTIQAADLGLAGETNGTGNRDTNKGTLKEVREEAERDVLVQTLTRTNFNISSAAQQLGVSRVTLYKLLKKYHLQQ
ncbi:MAG: sigma-54 dependent transcriptional regulator [Gammaproteobacteria bacterium]|nr:sigma-54 dependent transcriptional regulator [Gammaproteobacteria bacterium]